MAANPTMPDFFHLLNEAHSASEEVDLFDLDSKKPESMKEFNKLNRDQYKAAKALIEYVQVHGEVVLAELEKMFTPEDGE